MKKHLFCGYAYERHNMHKKALSCLAESANDMNNKLNQSVVGSVMLLNLFNCFS